MKTLFHPASGRGHANHGWLNAHHSFSFANWYDPQKIHFGMLRVLNDDEIAAGMGFGTHPHDNMEIVTIPLEGMVMHKDSMGNSGIIKAGDVQVMSAGTGVHHSEFNGSKTDLLRLLQIWVFPKVDNVTPRYEQVSYEELAKQNEFQVLVSPKDEGGAVWVHQDCFFNIGRFDTGQSLNYTIKKPGNGAYVFLIDGEAQVAGQALQRRDVVGVTEAADFAIETSQASRILIIEVPMR